jgi:hypothetical protein
LLSENSGVIWIFLPVRKSFEIERPNRIFQEVSDGRWGNRINGADFSMGGAIFSFLYEIVIDISCT